MIEKDKLLSIFNDTVRSFPKADEVAALAIRKAITVGALPPGELINEMEIAGWLELSRMPIRQAMVVLESEGLVKRVYKKGVFVTELTKSEIEEIYHMRARLESLAVRVAVPKMKKSDLNKSRLILDNLDDSELENERFLELNAEFHISLYTPSGWNNLLKKITELRNNAARYIAISHNLRTAPYRIPHASDHAKIFAACEKGDVNEAEKLIEEHVFNNLEVLLKNHE